MKFLLAEAASVPAEPLIDLAKRGAMIGPEPAADISFTPLLWMAFLGPGGDIQDLGGSDDPPILLRLVDALADDSVRMKGDRLSVLHPELVTEFRLPQDGLTTTRRADGTWRAQLRLPPRGSRRRSRWARVIGQPAGAGCGVVS